MPGVGVEDALELRDARDFVLGDRLELFAALSEAFYVRVSVGQLDRPLGRDGFESHWIRKLCGREQCETSHQEDAASRQNTVNGGGRRATAVGGTTEVRAGETG